MFATAENIEIVETEITVKATPLFELNYGAFTILGYENDRYELANMSRFNNKQLAADVEQTVAKFYGMTKKDQIIHHYEFDKTLKSLASKFF